MMGNSRSLSVGAPTIRNSYVKWKSNTTQENVIVSHSSRRVVLTFHFWGWQSLAWSKEAKFAALMKYVSLLWSFLSFFWFYASFLSSVLFFPYLPLIYFYGFSLTSTSRIFFFLLFLLLQLLVTFCYFFIWLFSFSFPFLSFSFFTYSYYLLCSYWC
jgi:hypothetical protein